MITTLDGHNAQLSLFNGTFNARKRLDEQLNMCDK